MIGFPSWTKLALIGAAAAILVTAYATQAVRISLLHKDVAAAQTAEQSASQAAAAWKRTTEAERGERAKEAAHARTTQETLDEERTRTAAARAAADRAAGAADGLRRAAAAAAAACGRAVPAHPADASSSPPAADPGMVLADVLGRARGRLQELGKLADERGIAGSTCERERDPLTSPAE